MILNKLNLVHVLQLTLTRDQSWQGFTGNYTGHKVEMSFRIYCCRSWGEGTLQRLWHYTCTSPLYRQSCCAHFSVLGLLSQQLDYIID